MPNYEWPGAALSKSKRRLEAAGFSSNQDNVPPQELRVEAIDSDKGYWTAKLVNTRHGGGVAWCPHANLHLTRSDAIRCGRQHLHNLVASEMRRSEWSAGPEDEPVAAPFMLGARVEYIGLSSRDLENGIPVHRSEVGVIVQVEAPGRPGTEHELPEDGRCTVRFHDVEGDEDTIWPRYDEPSWKTLYRLLES